MVKNVHLHLDEKFFYKLKEDKILVEQFKGAMTWEEYIEYFFKINTGGKNDRR